MRTTSEEAQRAIIEAALITFRKRGYVPATLEEIGAHVELTRGAVLHHFKSKGRLLAAVVDPCRQALAQLRVTVPLNDPATPGERRQLLTRFVEVLIAHRETLGLLANDISARVQLGLDEQWFMPEAQLVSQLVGTRTDDVDLVRAAAALGAMIQPLTWAWVDLDGATARAVLIDAAEAVLRRPCATGSDPVSRIVPTSAPVGAAPGTGVAAS